MLKKSRSTIKAALERVRVGAVTAQVITLAYVAFLTHFLANSQHDLLRSKPADLGDFLAGAFAPLAFLWLVIGHLMQGRELRLQREELALQRQSLDLQVAEPKSMVMVQKQQADFAKLQAEAAVESVKNTERERLRASKPTVSAELVSNQIHPAGNGYPQRFTPVIRIVNAGETVFTMQGIVRECYAILAQGAQPGMRDLAPNSAIELNCYGIGPPVTWCRLISVLRSSDYQLWKLTVFYDRRSTWAEVTLYDHMKNPIKWHDKMDPSAPIPEGWPDYPLPTSSSADP